MVVENLIKGSEVSCGYDLCRQFLVDSIPLSGQLPASACDQDTGT